MKLFKQTILFTHEEIFQIHFNLNFWIKFILDNNNNVHLFELHSAYSSNIIDLYSKIFKLMRLPLIYKLVHIRYSKEYEAIKYSCYRYYNLSEILTK